MIGDALAFLAEHRANAEALMTSTWLVERLSDDAPLVGFTPTPTRTTVYEGRGRLRSDQTYERSTTTEGATVVVQRMRLSVPFGAFSPEPGDVATCTASDNPSLVGRVFRITQRPASDHLTAYRMTVDEVIV